MSDQKATLVAKVTTVLFGLTCFALAFLAANVKTILEASIAFVGSITGPILGVFTLGIFFPRANAIVSPLPQLPKRSAFEKIILFC